MILGDVRTLRDSALTLVGDVTYGRTRNTGLYYQVFPRQVSVDLMFGITLDTLDTLGMPLRVFKTCLQSTPDLAPGKLFRS